MIYIVGGCDLREWVRSRIPGMKDKFSDTATCIGFGDEKRLLGAVVYSDYNGYDMRASIAVEPKSNWASRRVLRALFRYPFIDNNCIRLTVLCAKKNKTSRSMVERMGFKYEGNMRWGFGDDDLIAYGMLKEECRWIK